MRRSTKTHRKQGCHRHAPQKGRPGRGAGGAGPTRKRPPRGCTRARRTDMRWGRGTYVDSTGSASPRSPLFLQNNSDAAVATPTRHPLRTPSSLPSSAGVCPSAAVPAAHPAPGGVGAHRAAHVRPPSGPCLRHWGGCGPLAMGCVEQRGRSSLRVSRGQRDTNGTLLQCLRLVTAMTSGQCFAGLPRRLSLFLFPPYLSLSLSLSLSRQPPPPLTPDGTRQSLAGDCQRLVVALQQSGVNRRLTVG